MKLQSSNYGGWRPTVPASLNRLQKYWLLRPGALTAGLRQLGQVELKVVQEYSGGLTAAESWMLQRPAKSPVWVREIVMSIDGSTSVVARSFTPLGASHGWWQGMRRLRTRPLADMLYHSPQITRSAFFVCRLTPLHPFYGTVKRALGREAPPAQALLARCSIFWRQGQPLLVAECFLPGFWQAAAGAEYGQRFLLGAR
jgi:chorismate--pyruvate lyase